MSPSRFLVMPVPVCSRRHATSWVDRPRHPSCSPSTGSAASVLMKMTTWRPVHSTSSSSHVRSTVPIEFSRAKLRLWSFSGACTRYDLLAYTSWSCSSLVLAPVWSTAQKSSPQNVGHLQGVLVYTCRAGDPDSKRHQRCSCSLWLLSKNMKSAASCLERQAELASEPQPTISSKR